jgi:hypothetical protein
MLLEFITKNTIGPYIVLEVYSDSVLVDRLEDTPLNLRLSNSVEDHLEVGSSYYFEIYLGKVVSVTKV